MKKPKTYTFQEFLEFFPEIDLPINLTEESIWSFQKENLPLPLGMIHQFIVPLEGAEPDEFTEFVPCFRLMETHDMHAIVYWRAELLVNQYVLCTLQKDGTLIKSATIGGMTSDGKVILRSVASIDADWIIHIVEGHESVDKTIEVSKDSQSYSMELLATGEIIFLT